MIISSFLLSLINERLPFYARKKELNVADINSNILDDISKYLAEKYDWLSSCCHDKNNPAINELHEHILAVDKLREQFAEFCKQGNSEYGDLSGL